MKVKDINEIKAMLSTSDRAVDDIQTMLTNLDGRRLRHESSDLTSALVALKRAHQSLQKVRVSFEERTDGLEG